MSQRVLIMGGIVWRFAFLLGVFKAIKTGGITWRFWVVLYGISCFVLCGIVWRLPVLTAHYMRIKNGWYWVAFWACFRFFGRVVLYGISGGFTGLYSGGIGWRLGGGSFPKNKGKTKAKQRRNKKRIKKRPHLNDRPLTNGQQAGNRRKSWEYLAVNKR